MLSAKRTILVHFKSVRVVLLVFHSVVISLFALGASKRDLSPHPYHSFPNYII